MTRDWFPVIAAPIAWFAALVAGWMLTPPAHEDGPLTTLHVIHLIAIGIIVVAGISAAVRLRGSTGSRRFLAWGGLGLAALTLLLVIGLAVPTLILFAGAEP
jgi:hypothetical protein